MLELDELPPEAPAPEAEVPPELPDDDEPPLFAPQSFAAYFASVGLRFAHLDEDDLLFWPECVAAAVFVAFSCDAPLLLMWLEALSRPVDLLLLGVSIEEPLVEPVLDEPLVPSEPDVEPLLPMDEPEPAADAPLPDVDDVPLPYVLPVALEPFELLLPALL